MRHLMQRMQRWNPEQYAKNASFVPELGRPAIDMLAPKAGERILDLGCGDGVLTQKLLEAGCEVIAIDADSEQVKAACARGINARVMDAQQLFFSNDFDAVFSNAALHWMPEADAVIAGVWRALKRGGRFVGEFGGEGNCRTVQNALRQSLESRGVDAGRFDPWYFPSADEYRGRLLKAGFTLVSAEIHDRPTTLPGHLMGWLETFAGSFTQALLPEERQAYLEEVCAQVAPQLCDDKGQWTVDYKRLRFAARKP